MNRSKAQHTALTARPVTFVELTELWTGSRRTLDWHCLFTLPPWLQTWWSIFRTDQEPHIVAVQRGPEIIALAPFMRRDTTAELIGSPDVCDYLDVVGGHGTVNGFAEPLLEHLRQSGIHLVTLQGVRPDARVWTDLLPVARSKNWYVTCEQEDVAYQIQLPQTWDAFLQQLNGKQRHELRRKLRRLDEAGTMQFRQVAAGLTEPATVELFLELFRASRPDKATFMTTQMAAYFHALAQSFSDLDMLMLGVLELDGQAVSAVMGFDYQGTRYLYNSGYDPAYRSLSVGLLCKVLSIQDAIAKGFSSYDLLKGAETYKQRLGARATKLYRCTIQFT